MALAVRSFEEEWPAVADGLERVLARRRVPRALRDDIVQETGLRVLKNWDHFDMERPLWPLALTIAMNLVRDDVRERTRHNRVELVNTEAAATDIEREAIARLELKRVERALARLTPAQRSVLLAEVGAGDGEHLKSTAVNMLRMRARRRLKGLLEEVSGFISLAGIRLRDSKLIEAIGSRANFADESNRVAAAVLTTAGAFSFVLGALPGGPVAPRAAAATPATPAVITQEVAPPDPQLIAQIEDRSGRIGRDDRSGKNGGRIAARLGSTNTGSDRPSADPGEPTPADDDLCVVGCGDNEIEPDELVAEVVEEVHEQVQGVQRRDGVDPSDQVPSCTDPTCAPVPQQQT